MLFARRRGKRKPRGKCCLISVFLLCALVFMFRSELSSRTTDGLVPATASCSSPQSTCAAEKLTGLRRFFCPGRGLTNVAFLTEKLGTSLLFRDAVPKILQEADDFQKLICFSQFREKEQNQVRKTPRSPFVKPANSLISFRIYSFCPQMEVRKI